MLTNEIQTISVLGAGTMGPGLALSYALHGYDVLLWSKDQELLPMAKIVIQSGLETLSKFEDMSEDKISSVLSKIKYLSNLEDALENTDYVIEAIVENIDAKKDLYLQLDQLLNENVIIASNTSVLNIFELMPQRRLAKTIITHWFAPPHIVPLVEVVKGENTSNETIETVMVLLKKIGKAPILLNHYVPGFIINRLQMILSKEVFYLLDQGFISPEDFDTAVRTSLAPRMMVLGLVQRIDFTGLDLTARNITNNQYQQPPENNHPHSLFDLVEKGNLGLKNGKGFFDYSDTNKANILQERDEKLIQAFKCSKDWDYVGKSKA